ncbi:hypothetical protein H103_03610 [Trichophyton rubrum CBS 288.86]|uniref:Uncharacterized protein n=1 Tax=Trichophyton rubrum CBS 288.86 TaxID=1215330 RepID=A0A022W542_TRIRU|nr:hypothetical protein H100_03608 [Trichophyton rubrum MR850]EZF42830.1 hypothetical protein H102_03601 [Trichophyton rubrum CBS 100081]EZF53457.1 hypothetical protein H103_03610 [Trichophyton rubrum CBS 288.86]EZF85369.1 hypothetical protein H110_03610 [Trichophyton rubrum MR1448]
MPSRQKKRRSLGVPRRYLRALRLAPSDFRGTSRSGLVRGSCLLQQRLFCKKSLVTRKIVIYKLREGKSRERKVENKSYLTYSNINKIKEGNNKRIIRISSATY